MRYFVIRASISCLMLLLINTSVAYSALENLDEIIARKARKLTNTFYSGESAGNSYLWQPQTLCYTDITSGHEVWIMTSTDGADSYSGHEYGHHAWSADGKRFALAIDKDTSAFARKAYAFNQVWFTSRSDGTHLRPRTGAAARIRTHSLYTHWSPTIPDVYYEFGRNYAYEGKLPGHLYKVTVSDTNVSSVDWLTFSSSERALSKDAITSDGKYILATYFSEKTAVAIAQIEPTPSLVLPEYNIDRSLDTYWGDTPASYHTWHDEMFVGTAGNYWIYFMPEGSATWWRMRPWGTDGLAPNHTPDTTLPYVWWEGTPDQKEIQALNVRLNLGTRPYPIHYWSHAVPDRWGGHIAYSDTEGAYVAPAVHDVDNVVKTAFPTSSKAAQYHAWTGWTDYTTGTSGADYVYYMKYNDSTTHAHIASIHTSVSSIFVKPGQSPDGTKTVYRSNFLQPTSSNGDVIYVVTEYPYPPEITQVSAFSGDITIKFDWQNTLADPNPRTYTARGWPNEATSDRPIPRETNKFRLWRSTDNSTWKPVGTVNAEPFTRFDFVNGGFKGGQNSYWEITDAPGDGTWYYAVTSIEHSGLESRSLSNTWAVVLSGGSISGAGVEASAYPADPGGVSGFYTTLPPAPSNLAVAAGAAAGQYKLTWQEPPTHIKYSTIRYYNIYYSTTGTPPTTQQYRIASIPARKGITTWLDWLADQGAASHYYRITSVDTQGNEGTGTVPEAPSNLIIK